jgi:hypothetical protein
VGSEQIFSAQQILNYSTKEARGIFIAELELNSQVPPSPVALIAEW